MIFSLFCLLVKVKFLGKIIEGDDGFFIEEYWDPLIGGFILSIFLIFLEFYRVPLNIAKSLKNLDFIVIAPIGGAFISSCFSK
ncbi:MAG: hypothetical protein ACPLW7_06060 [Minisyncoccia bacterium]